LHYLVDPDWPKTLPNNWIMGQVAGLAIDKYDNIWAYQRPRSLDAPGGGPFSLSASVPRLRPVPATSDRRPAVPVVDASSERRAGKEMILPRFVSLPDAG